VDLLLGFGLDLSDMTMKRFSCLLVLFCSMLLPCILVAQKIERQKDPRFSLKKNWPDLAFATATVSSLLAEQLVKPLTPTERQIYLTKSLPEAKWGATSVYSPKFDHTADIVAASITLGSIVWLYWPTTKKRSFIRYNIYLYRQKWYEGACTTLFLTQATKIGVQRPRPFLYNTTSPTSLTFDKDARMSFFSGHTSFTAFHSVYWAGLLAQNTKQKWKKNLIWSAGLATPLVVGALRVKGSKHFPTDVAAGYALGTTVALVQLWRTKQYRKKHWIGTPNF
jgi:membrane-associated phospholipid phosphatase